MHVFLGFLFLQLSTKEEYIEKNIDEMQASLAANMVLQQEFGTFPLWRWAILFPFTQESLGDGGLLLDWRCWPPCVLSDAREGVRPGFTH